MQLKSVSILSDKQRNSCIDVFRGLAIIGVVLFHYNSTLPYGHLGVDLFFVISGLLVGGLLTKDFNRGKKINFFKFFLQRGFKIWPSYYVFLIVGNVVAYFFYLKIEPEQFIPLWDISRYLFFYQNYTGAPYHSSFDGIWSLCVEEHFYIMLPLAFILLQAIRGNKRMLFFAVGLVIFAGILFKVLSLYLTNSKDTYAGTHNRIDALAWGVLLNLCLTYYPQLFQKGKQAVLYFFLGLTVFAAALLIEVNTASLFYHKVMLHSIIPIGFFLMIAGLYKYDFSSLNVLRFIAYYSYNWYLWHGIFRPAIIHYVGYTTVGLILYLILSFATAMFFTIVIEEPCLANRNRIIDYFFRKDKIAKTAGLVVDGEDRVLDKNVA